MRYYIVTYLVIVDKESVYNGSFGQKTDDTNSMLEATRAVIEYGYYKLYPKAVIAQVFALKMLETTEPLYLSFERMQKKLSGKRNITAFFM